LNTRFALMPCAIAMLDTDAPGSRHCVSVQPSHLEQR